MTGLKEKYKLEHEEAIWAKLLDNYVLVILRSPPGENLYKPFFAINKPAVDILDCLLEYKKTQEIIKLLARKYDISRQKAKRDLKKFIDILKKNKLIS